MRREIMGCPVDELDMAAFVDAIERHMLAGDKGWYTSINVANWYLCRTNPAIRDLVARATWISADGWPIAWVARHLYKVPISQVSAMDLFEMLMDRLNARQNGVRIFLVGGKEGIAAKAAKFLSQRYPHIDIVGAWHGYYHQNETAMLNAVNEKSPQIVFLGMGTPREQMWAAQFLPRTTACCAVGIGGGFDILAGVTKRAPRWMRRAGLEWLYRLAQEPRRLGWRYLRSNGAFVRAVLSSFLIGQFRKWVGGRMWHRRADGAEESFENIRQM